MAFKLSDEQQELQRGFRDFVAGRFPIEKAAEIADGTSDEALWGDVAQMGVFSLRLPESAGGLGLSHVDAALVFEELGRAIVPGPTVWTHLAAGLVDGAATGETVVTGLDLTTNRHTPYVLEHLDAAHAALVLKDDGVYRLDPASIEAKPVEIPLDPLTPVRHAATLPAGDKIADAQTASSLSLLGSLLSSAMLLGIAQAASEMAISYAKERVQFDRPIGSFQAIKHMLADTFVRQELARAAVYAAAGTLDHPEVGDVATAIAEAKLVAGESAMKCCRTSVQVHGGMGYTWEVPVHYFLKRTWALETTFGTVDEHADRIAATFGG